MFFSLVKKLWAYILQLLSNLVIWILRKRGPIPRHVAFIMDGNRRWAKKRHESSKKGHLSGYKTLKSALKWCLELGVKHVTVYAFSVDNFRRSKDEVGYLMGLAEEKLARIMRESTFIEKFQIRVTVVGDLGLLPPSLSALFAQVMLSTQKHSQLYMNVCFGYSSKREMVHAAQTVARAVQEHALQESEVTRAVYEESLYAPGQPPPDILIRTSGEIRLSDFLLWQIEQSYLAFVPQPWPDFSRAQLLRVVWAAQSHMRAVQKAPEGKIVPSSFAQWNRARIQRELEGYAQQAT